MCVSLGLYVSVGVFVCMGVYVYECGCVYVWGVHVCVCVCKCGCVGGCECVYECVCARVISHLDLSSSHFPTLNPPLPFTDVIINHLEQTKKVQFKDS